MTITEAEIKAHVLVHLSKRGFLAWNNPCGVARSLDGRRMIRFGIQGMPDVLAVAPGGRFLGIETKSESGRLRESQKRFQDRVEALGGIYLVVRSLEDLERGLAAYDL